MIFTEDACSVLLVAVISMVSAENGRLSNVGERERERERDEATHNSHFAHFFSI